MRRVNLYLLLSLFIAVTACNNGDDEDDLLGNWVLLNGFEGPSTANSVSFTIGDSAYICTGYNGTNRKHFDFLYVYVADKDYWEQRADLNINGSSKARSAAVGFSTATHGYVGTGGDKVNYYNDFFEYNPSTNTWDSIAPLGNGGAVGRIDAVGFSINNKGYVGGGYDNDGSYLNDFWEYDPSSDSWTKKPSMGGEKKRGASAFVIDNIAYVCGGFSGSYTTDFYSYNPATDVWTSLNELNDVSDDSFDDKYDEIPRMYAAAFVVGGKGYLIGGTKSSALSSVWEYTPSTDRWEEKTSLEKKGTDIGRVSPIAFTVKETGYVGTGYTGSTYDYNMFKFQPFEDKNEDD